MSFKDYHTDLDPKPTKPCSPPHNQSQSADTPPKSVDHPSIITPIQELETKIKSF